MKSKKRIAFVIGIIFLIGGCIPSLHPLYTKDDCVFESNLLGEWEEEDNNSNTWNFTKLDDNSYKLALVEDSVLSNFYIHLVKLGDDLYIDFFPDSKNVKCEVIDFYLLQVIYVHIFGKITINENEVEISLFDYDWIEKLFEQNKIRIPHEVLKYPDSKDENILLTASTEELQAFVKKYADDKNAFIKANILKRKKE
jgi:hypothetical protein